MEKRDPCPARDIYVVNEPGDARRAGLIRLQFIISGDMPRQRFRQCPQTPGN